MKVFDRILSDTRSKQTKEKSLAYFLFISPKCEHILSDAKVYWIGCQTASARASLCDEKNVFWFRMTSKPIFHRFVINPSYLLKNWVKFFVFDAVCGN